MKKFYSKYETDIVITILLLLLSAILFILIKNKNLDDLLVNLSSGIIGSIITIWGVEVLRRKNQEKRIAPARMVAKEEIIRLKNQLTCFVSNAFDITVYNHITDGNFSEENIKKAIIEIAKEFITIDILSLLKSLSVSQWAHLQENLPLIRKTLSEMLQLYQNVLPDEIFGQLLIVNKNFDQIYSTFGVFPDLLTKEEGDWPKNKNGEGANRGIRKVWIELYAGYLKRYYESIVKLSELLETVDF